MRLRNDETPNSTRNGRGGWEPRVARLENEVQNLGDEIRNLGETVRLQGGRLDTGFERIRDDIGAARRPNYQLMISGGFLVMALFAAAVSPLYQGVAYNRQDVQGIMHWQNDWMRGKLSSPGTEAKLAEINQKFVEVETQFHAFKERMVENEQYTKERADHIEKRVEGGEWQVGQAREALARLEERSHLGRAPVIP